MSKKYTLIVKCLNSLMFQLCIILEKLFHRDNTKYKILALVITIYVNKYNEIRLSM